MAYRYTYQYDTYGNMHSKYNGKTKKTDTYTYENTQWLDLLTAYNGKSISYDAIGNPLTYYNGTKFTWEKGRRLATADTSAGTSVKYTYDVDGIRIGKTVTKGTSTTEHKYYIQDGKIVAETWGGNELEFSYDEKGEPFAMIYNGTKYYYVTNLHGNVVRIMTASGSTVADYTYDAWGNVISSSGGTIRDINPLRYRGYYYDTETGLYYLNSRYYDPATCRFINADNQINSGLLGLNLFAYCENNPVNLSDSKGNMPIKTKAPKPSLSDFRRSAIGSKGAKKKGIVSTAAKTKSSFSLFSNSYRTTITTPQALINAGPLIGRIGFSNTMTIYESRPPGLFYSYTETNNGVNKVGGGVNLGGWLAAGIGASLDGNAFVEAQITPWIHGEVSAGRDGIGIMAGFVWGETTYDFEVKGGWGSIFAFIAPYMLPALVPIAFVPA